MSRRGFRTRSTEYSCSMIVRYLVPVASCVFDLTLLLHQHRLRWCTSTKYQVSSTSTTIITVYSSTGSLYIANKRRQAARGCRGAVSDRTLRSAEGSTLLLAMRSLVVHALVNFASAQLVHHNGDYVPASTVTDMCGDIDAMTATVNTECCSEATTGAQGTCHDDAAGSLSASGLTCIAAISAAGQDPASMVPGNVCAYNMENSGLPGFVSGTLLSDICPEACGKCATQHRMLYLQV